MHRFVNPLLLDSSAALLDAAGRGVPSRPEPKAEGPAFSEELASVQEKPPAPPAGAPPPTDKPEITPVAAGVREGVEDSDFTFDDFVDIINPLHHIPIVGAIYRYFSEDTIKPASRVIGDMAFGALTGSFIVSGIVSVVGAAIEQSTGISPEVQVANALFGPDDNQPQPERIEVASDERPEELPERAEEALPVGETSLMLASASPEADAELQVAETDGLAPERKTSPEGADANPVAKAPFGGVMAPVVSVAQAATQPPPLPQHKPVPERPLPDREAVHVASGGPQDLPPDFVRDMMMMALHKYQTASQLAPGGTPAPAAN